MTTLSSVLLIYPTQYRVAGLPIGLASLAAVLGESGRSVRLFDTAFYPDRPEAGTQNLLRAELGMSLPVANEADVRDNETDLFEDLTRLLESFRPNIVGVSLLESTVGLALPLLEHVKRWNPEAFIIAGGVFATFSPEFTLGQPCIDAICVGEGELPLLQLCERLEQGAAIDSIQGVWTKTPEGELVRTKPAALHNIELLPPPDFRAFDPRLLLKPMRGRLRKMVNIETSRGCPFSCAYCAAPSLADFARANGEKRYYRRLSPKTIQEQIRLQIERHSPEFIYFSSETFLSMPDHEFKEFIAFYSGIGLPFWIQTRFETLTRDKVKALRDVGLFWMTIGVEHGNEGFRRNILHRNYTNKKALEGIEILSKLGQGASLNNMMGFPGETEELIFDTMRLNREMLRINPLCESNIFLFVPYLGTHLYDRCVQEGLVRQGEYCGWTTTEQAGSVLAFPRHWRDRIQGLRRIFNLYIHLPEQSLPDVIAAAELSESGTALYNSLCALFAKGR